MSCEAIEAMSYLYHTVEYPSIRCDVILERRMKVDYQKRRAKKKNWQYNMVAVGLVF